MRYSWVVAVGVVTLAFLAIAIAVSHHIGIPIRDPEGTLLGKRVVLPFIFMGIFLGLDVVIRARRLMRRSEISRTFALRTVFIERWWWQRIVIALLGFSMFHVTYLSYRNLKSFLPLFNYRTYDAELLQTDRWLSFGHAPATAMHNMLGDDVMAHLLSTAYLAFVPFVPISVAAALTFSSRLRDGFVYVSAAIYCWILGTISYYLIPTLGPFASARWQFRDLPVTGVTRLQDVLIQQRLDLYADPIGIVKVQSVAGFASLHVGMVFTAYLVARHFRHRLLGWALLAALVPTTLATIYFGWHFIVDDIAGLLIGWLAVVFARWTVYPRVRFAALARRAPDVRREGPGSSVEAVHASVEAG